MKMLGFLIFSLVFLTPALAFADSADTDWPDDDTSDDDTTGDDDIDDDDDVTDDDAADDDDTTADDDAAADDDVAKDDDNADDDDDNGGCSMAKGQSNALLAVMMFAVGFYAFFYSIRKKD